ncbi:LOW QUALITY PROTEIN: hypothetical protein ElyMa_005773400 [Elysia marginata]|uniref:Uncharacterized protein n=1 Tax=Elysia marginata TaxID=1093978 RepID=A0AAV4FSQ3_9GAST|nr:LOW QUALITY PROTEIN: hypothetical protein ElyMa_005773400 [Elysia marginata]
MFVPFGLMVVFALSQVHVGSTSRSSPSNPVALYVCSHADANLIMLMEGQPASMCCDISHFCKQEGHVSLNDTLTLLPLGVKESDLVVENDTDTAAAEVIKTQTFEMRRTDACRVELLIKHPPPGRFPLACRLKGQVLSVAYTPVVPKPPVPKITKVISTPDKKMIEIVVIVVVVVVMVAVAVTVVVVVVEMGAVL